MRSSIVILVLSVLLLSGTARAQDKGFGLGTILGDPTGLSFKNWVNSDAALDGAAAWSFGNNNSFQFHVDYLLHRFDLFNVQTGSLPLYYGIGARVRLEKQGSRVGIRIPVGIVYMFDKDPFDIFFEIVPVLDLAPSTDAGLNAGIGGRYWF